MIRFTRCTTSVVLMIPDGADAARARLLAEKAESACLVANSQLVERELVLEVRHAAHP